jgi:hypothetical protein
LRKFKKYRRLKTKLIKKFRIEIKIKIKKMLETKEQKKYFIAILVMVVVLSLVTLFNRPHTQNQNTGKNTGTSSKFDAEAYLASLKIDQKASQSLYEEILPAEEVKKEVENELQTNQKIKMPEIDENKIQVVDSADNQTLVNYFKQHLDLLNNLKSLSSTDLANLNADFGSTNLFSLSKITKQVIDQFYKIPVPKEAVALHKNQIMALEGYADLFSVTASHQSDPENTNPWPAVYRDQVVIENSTQSFNKEFDKLDSKYSINKQLQKEFQDYAKGNFFIPAAKALFGLGDIVIDIKAVLRDVYQTALSAAYVQFAKEFLDKLVTKIESNYKIANYLYYTDALTSGQYVDDYLNKYFTGDELEKTIVKNFIPQMNCSNRQDLSGVFKAKASQYLGFDPNTVNLSDPNYYQKMAKVGNFLSSPEGWEIYYQDIASQAGAKAQESSLSELYSQGLKAGRDPKAAGDIVTTMATVSESLRSALYSFFGVGTVLADKTAGMIAGTAVQVFIKGFVFKGVVLKEQQTCIGVPQINPVIPFASANGKQTIEPTNQAAVASACSREKTLDDDCTKAILGELDICANNSSQHTGTLSCVELSGMPYVDALLQDCKRTLVSLSSKCVNLQNWLHAIKP